MDVAETFFPILIILSIILMIILSILKIKSANIKKSGNFIIVLNYFTIIFALVVNIIDLAIYNIISPELYIFIFRIILVIFQIPIILYVFFLDLIKDGIILLRKIWKRKFFVFLIFQIPILFIGDIQERTGHSLTIAYSLGIYIIGEMVVGQIIIATKSLKLVKTFTNRKLKGRFLILNIGFSSIFVVLITMDLYNMMLIQADIVAVVFAIFMFVSVLFIYYGSIRPIEKI
ncbi:MAG: hypothetical protein ACTSU2_17380 [Promethearchaeota archaeon]